MPAQPNPLRLERDAAIFRDRAAGMTWSKIEEKHELTQANAYIAAKRHAKRYGLELPTVGSEPTPKP